MRVQKGCDVKRSLCDILSIEGTCVLRRLNHIILSFSFLTMLGHYTSDLQLNERLVCFLLAMEIFPFKSIAQRNILFEARR